MVLRDVVGAPPPTGAFSCDTGKCREYIEQVDKLSKALTERWTTEAQLAEADAAYPMTAKQKIAFLADFKTWVEAHRLPWLDRYATLRADCDSTFAGPCKEAQNVAAKHEEAVIKWAEKFKGYTKKDTGIDPVDQGKDPKDKGGWGFPSFAPSASTIALLAMGIGLAIYLKKLLDYLR